MTRLLFVRHGQSEANLKGIFAGHINPALTELGYRQAECTADFIAKTYHVDAVYSSDLQRAYHTGLAVGRKLNLPVTTDPGLREIFAGSWEGRSFVELAAEHSPAYIQWFEDIGNAKCPGGEAVAELADRIYQTVRRIAEANEGKTVVLALHATPIRTVEWTASGKDLSHMQQIPWVTNASVSEYIYENGVLTPVKISQDSHLGSMVTALPTNI